MPSPHPGQAWGGGMTIEPQIDLWELDAHRTCTSLSGYFLEEK